MNANIAVVGGGYWGKNLIRNFHELGALRMVCDTSPELLAIHARQFDGIEMTDSFAAVLGNASVHGVVIATPPETHVPLTLVNLDGKMEHLQLGDIFPRPFDASFL